jgi:hypothetical protein
MLYQPWQKYHSLPSRFSIYLSLVTHNGYHLSVFILITFASVTSVGGTTGIHEIAANFSGGGFSDYVRAFGLTIYTSASLISWQFPRPAFQDAAVKKYLAQFPEDLYRGLFNR